MIAIKISTIFWLKSLKRTKKLIKHHDDFRQPVKKQEHSHQNHQISTHFDDPSTMCPHPFQSADKE